MSRRIGLMIFGLLLAVFVVHHVQAQWKPPSEVSREGILASSKTILGRPDIPYRAQEDIFRIRVLEMVGYGSYGV